MCRFKQLHLDSQSELDTWSYELLFSHNYRHYHLPKYWPFLLNHPVVVLAGFETVLLSADGCSSRRVSWAKPNCFLEQLTLVMWVWRNMNRPYYQISFGGWALKNNSFYDTLLSYWGSGEVLAHWDRGIEPYSSMRNWTPVSFCDVGFLDDGPANSGRSPLHHTVSWRSVECTKAFFTSKT